ncbi:hypothetical protein N234_26155 [Ralstonia pickettii DTP0602]|nr:hypothetical protein N234_26155 [Ralstonia pickettii DTP0602]
MLLGRNRDDIVGSLRADDPGNPSADRSQPGRCLLRWLSGPLASSCVNDGLAFFINATTPAAIGVAAEVPSSLVEKPVKFVIEQKSGLLSGSSAAGPWLL